MENVDQESMRGVGEWSTETSKGTYFNIMSQLDWWTHQLSFFKKQLAEMKLSQQPLSIVDAGIATGLTTCEVLGYLQEMGHTIAEVHGYDGDAASLAEAQENIRQRFPHVKFFAHLGNLVTTHDFHRADGVIVSQVLQYLNAGEHGYAYQVLRDLMNSLQPNGFIIGGLTFNTFNSFEVMTRGGQWKDLLPKILNGRLPLGYLLHTLKVIRENSPKTYPDRDTFKQVLLDGCANTLATESLWGLNKPVNGEMQYVDMGFAFAGNPH